MSLPLNKISLLFSRFKNCREWNTTVDFRKMIVSSQQYFLLNEILLEADVDFCTFSKVASLTPESSKFEVENMLTIWVRLL